MLVPPSLPPPSPVTVTLPPFPPPTPPTHRCRLTRGRVALDVRHARRLVGLPRGDVQVLQAVEALHLHAKALHQLDGHVDVGLADQLIADLDVDALCRQQQRK